MPKIAIVGAGFSGLGLCYHLLQCGYQVTLFDPKGIGGGASGIASGLLHPYPGESARMSWRGLEAMREAELLIDKASEALGRAVARKEGILHLAISEKKKEAFLQRANTQDDVEWWDAKTCHERVKGAHFCPGIFIRSGQTVHPKLYLKGLWEVCQKEGAELEKKEVDVASLKGFDQIVIAAGSGIRKMKECESLNVKLNKGQLLVCTKPSYFNPGFSLVGKGYLALSEDENRCYLGSTYEHEFITEQPCIGHATEMIFSRIGQFLPSYGAFEVTECLSGMRVVNRKTYHPIVGKLREGVWVLTAMGSRGLLYHGLMGKMLAQAIVANDPLLIPKEVRL
ncbi:MAG: FAD-dependent oxidoreductase [Simkania sp.]|nr:FAD-dependent oxidoreductase [Simkania sp.]MCB1074244.1 FAD-dependent oxidoreductase [Simkania sp.]MCP5489925.1 FAD-dependent oxidoreductase [Chlamydiales bacterium]